MKTWIAIVAATAVGGWWLSLELRAMPQDESAQFFADDEPLQPEPLPEDLPPTSRKAVLAEPVEERVLPNEFAPPKGDRAFIRADILPPGSSRSPNMPIEADRGDSDFLAHDDDDPGRQFNRNVVDRELPDAFDRRRQPATSDPQQVALGKIQYIKNTLAAGNGDRDKLEKNLKAALDAYFAADMQKRQKELDGIRKRLTQMEAKLKKRSDSQQKIVELQLTLLLHEADGLGFFAPGHRLQGQPQRFTPAYTLPIDDALPANDFTPRVPIQDPRSDDGFNRIDVDRVDFIDRGAN